MCVRFGVSIYCFNLCKRQFHGNHYSPRLRSHCILIRSELRYLHRDESFSSCNEIFIALVQISVNECRNVVKFMAIFPLWLLSRRRLCAGCFRVKAQQLDVKIQLRRRTNAKSSATAWPQKYSLCHITSLFMIFSPLLRFPSALRRRSEHPKR